MKTKIKKILFVMICLAGVFPCWLNGQDKDKETLIPKDQVMALARQIEQQQVQIEENQIIIATKLAEITENVRQAWVFSRRASK